MNSLNITIAGGQLAFSPGEEIAVQVAWSLEERPSSLELRLIWYTQGKGDTDQSVVQKFPITDSAASGQGRFSLTLPRAPYSFSGKLISLIWALEFVAEPGGLSHRENITIAPDAAEVELYS